jgi:hypothetical protein
MPLAPLRYPQVLTHRRERVPQPPGNGPHPTPGAVRNGRAYGHQPDDGERPRRCQPGLDPPQPVVRGLDRVGGRVQGAAQQLVVVPVGLGHIWLCSASRSDDMAREA